MTTDLDRLIEAVEAGTAEPKLFYAALTIRAILAEIAYYGSLDEAVALFEALQAENQRLRDALRECEGALDLHGKMYPAMVKGYTLDALNAARAALRSTREGG